MTGAGATPAWVGAAPHTHEEGTRVTRNAADLAKSVGLSIPHSDLPAAPPTNPATAGRDVPLRRDVGGTIAAWHGSLTS